MRDTIGGHCFPIYIRFSIINWNRSNQPLHSNLVVFHDSMKKWRNFRIYETRRHFFKPSIVLHSIRGIYKKLTPGTLVIHVVC